MEPSAVTSRPWLLAIASTFEVYKSIHVLTVCAKIISYLNLQKSKYFNPQEKREKDRRTGRPAGRKKDRADNNNLGKARVTQLVYYKTGLSQGLPHSWY